MGTGHTAPHKQQTNFNYKPFLKNKNKNYASLKKKNISMSKFQLFFQQSPYKIINLL